MHKLIPILLLYTIVCNAGTLSPVKLKQTKSRCDRGSYIACHDMGQHYDHNSNLKKASHYYKKSCSLKGAIGCAKLAELYLVGAGVKQSNKNFRTYLSRACSLGDKMSCSSLKKNDSLEKLIKTVKKSSSKGPIDEEFEESGIGSIRITADLLDKSKRSVVVYISMTNRFASATGWLSLSFPQLHDDRVLASSSQGFKSVNSYPDGYSIYSNKEKKAINSKYLLVEGEAKKWRRGITKSIQIKLNVPNNINSLIIDIRGTFKSRDRLKSIPSKGFVGQQGFSNYRIKIPIRRGNNRVIDNSNQGTYQELLTQQDKLILLDQLLHFSYYHRSKDAFEKQLKETLFGGAKYYTHIKQYICKSTNNPAKNKCILRVGGDLSKNNQRVQWEFRIDFSVKKDSDGVRITTLDYFRLLEK